jgi:hypothetical protein
MNKLILSVCCVFLFIAPCNGLKLDEEYHLTDETGKVIPAQFVRAKVGDIVKIKRTDGFVYSGKITEIEQNDESFKLMGEIENVNNAHFGFRLAKGGVFVGAIVEHESRKTYVLEFSIEHKGFIFLQTFKYNSPLI